MNSRVFIVPAFALLINIVLFALLPLFIHIGSAKTDLESIVPINIIQLKRHTPPPREEDKKELPEKKKPEKVIPTVRLNLQKKVIPQRPEIETPQLTFEINPRLAGGMAVSPPPKEPTVFPTQKFKDSYDQGEVDQMPIPVFKMKPIYPYRARRLNVTGAVEVKFLVDERGHVNKIKIIKSRPAGMFDTSVLKALPSWKFSPGKVRGHAVSTWVVTTIEFKMEE